MLGVLAGLGPWILYWILVSNNTFKEAAAAGLVASVVVLVWSMAHGVRPKILEIGTVAWFAVLTIGAYTADEKFFAEWSFVLSNVALGAIMLVSILVGHPFARQYAQDSVPEQYWDTPIFKQSTLVISWAWVGALVLMAASSAVSVEVPEEELWFNWIIPIGLMVLAFKFTHWYPDYRKKQQHHDPALAGL